MPDNTPRSLMPYYRFARLSGIDPLHAMQVYLPVTDEVRSGCGDPIFQYDWQTAQRLGRDSICGYIAQAEDRIAEQLGYDLLPTWNVERSVQYASGHTPIFTSYNQPTTTTGLWPSLRTRKKYVQVGGREALSLIQSGATIAYTDADGDGYKETATISVVTSVTNPEEISLFYPGKSDFGWEIRPIIPTISGGIATIVCHREQLVLPSLLDGYVTTAVNGLDNAEFLTTVDVYRHYNDPSTMIQMLWEPFPLWCGCPNCSCLSPSQSSDCNQGCSVSYMNGCLSVRDSEAGIVSAQPGTYDATANTYSQLPFAYNRAPDRANIWYKAGWMDSRSTYPNLSMDPRWERIVVGLVLSMLDRPITSCPSFETQYGYYANDLARSNSHGGDASAYQIGKDLNNPMGTKVGEILAWREIRKQMLPL